MPTGFNVSLSVADRHNLGTDFLSDTSEHLWRTAAATPPNARFPGDYRQVVSRSKFDLTRAFTKLYSVGNLTIRWFPLTSNSAVPAKLDPTLMKEPRVIQGVPRLTQTRTRRKPIPSMLSSPLTSGSPPA